ncbi:PREDICTED: glutamyl aminopeptidase-like isoform X2 [Papilio polytes]|uniref:glutamyl aminopeptidase-like isoform X2 n=1 Tax=Papilio polytes TaxID=76194 RepID=UPI000675DA20|nr:PREDICTED: glutamyl aminopeptidase-like isoform X2 [Papilio polytes]
MKIEIIQKDTFKNRECFFNSCASMISRSHVLRSTLKLNRLSFCHNKQNHNKIKIMENVPSTALTERLSPLVRPGHYRLLLSPNLDNGVFQGNVKIDVIAKHQNNHISLHTKFLNIETVKVYKNGEEFPIQKWIEMKNLEQLVIIFNNVLSSGTYNIHINFSGDLTRNIVGFYLSHLKDKSNMVASKFQPTYARQAFPCFDEPDFKATYDITLVKPVSYVALSNMNEISKTQCEDKNTEAVTFATSVPMSTYLACFVVCDFDFKETEIDASGIGNNFKLRSFAQRNQMHKIDFAQDIGARATEFYIKYYEVPFPLPKLDMIAIPDYVSGATEHWGLITYRETSFLVDEATASSKNKISVANTIAHELAHMWFGNLVTMKWWDEVWLNEGFASYMQVKALNAIEPSWTMLDQFLTKTLHSVLVTDAKLSSHPILQTVETPDQITAIFDAISYNKGSSILRMLEGFIGEENFRRGISDYLKKYKYGNTVTQDLLSCLEPYFKMDNPNLNLSYIMDTWIKQMGYPVLNVKSSEEANTFVVTQTRFLLDPDAVQNNDSPFNYRWFIPITYTTNKGKYQKVLWFADNEDNVKLHLKDGEKWLKINNNQMGYYRVNYQLDMWENLIHELKNKSEQLTISDRAHLLNDVFAMAEARLLPYDLALNLTTYLREERDYVPWDTASSVFSQLSSRLRNTEIYDDLQKYVQSLVEPVYREQSWTKSNFSVIEGLLRTRILSLATGFSLPDAEDRVRSLFLRSLNSHGTSDAVLIDPDLRDFVYYYGMRSATQSDWDKLWQIYLKEDDVQELAKLRHALAAPRDATLLQRYLTLAWDESNVRSQDYLNVVQFISSNPVGAALVWGDVRARWPQLVDRFTLNSRYLGGLLPAITSTFDTTIQLHEMEEFFKKYPEAGAGESARKRALETVRNNIRWAETQKPAVAAWLKAHV